MKKKQLVISYSLLILLFVLFIISLIFPKSTFSSKAYELKEIAPIGEIHNHDVIKQQFIAEDDYYKVGIFFANYGKLMNQGNLVLKIMNDDDQKKVIKTKLSTLEDNEYYYFDYPFKKNKKYVLSLTIEGAEDPISLYTTKARIKDTTLVYKGEDRKDTMILSFLYKKKDYFKVWYCLFAITFVVGYIILMKYSKEKGINPID